MPGPVLYAELQRAEEELREQRSLYETLLQVQSDLGECVIISDGNQIEYANPAAIQLFGYSKEELLALPSFLELVAPEDRDGMIQRLQRRFLGDATEELYETRVRNKEGREIIVEVAAKPIQLPNGIRIVTLMRDVTARRRLEAEIRRSEETLRALFDTSTAGIAELDPEGRFLRANAAFQRILGYEEEELKGRSLGSLTYAEDLPKHEEAFARLRQGATGAVLEKRMVRKDGSLVWVHNSLSLVRDAQGQPLKGIVVTRDVTEHRRLLETHARFTSIVESSNDGIVSASPDGVVQSWNPGMERITGYKAHEALGQHFQKFAPPDVHADQLAKFRSVLRGEGVVSYRTERIRRDGTRYPAAVTMSPMRGPRGEIVGVTAIVRDITEERAQEQQNLRAAEAEAEKLVAEASRERFAFLAEAGKILASSLDLPSRLSNIAALSVPRLADWCAVYLRDETGEIRSVSCAHRDRARVVTVERFTRRYPIDPKGSTGPARVIATGERELAEPAANEPASAAFPSQDQARALRELGLKASLTVPLQGRARTIGALFLALSDSSRRFTPDEVSLAEEFAQRASLAIENALLYEQRRRAEDSLRRLAAIVEASEDAIIGASLDGTVISWNEGAQRLFGYSAGEILGRPWTLLVPMEREGELAGLLARLRAGQHVEHFESERVAKDGRRIAVSVGLSPIRDPEGNLIGMSTIMRDITERARYEEALESSRMELEERVWALEALHELGEAIAHAPDLQGLLDAAMASLRKALRADRTAVLTYDDQGVMRFRAWHGLSDDYRAKVEGHSPWRRDEPDPKPVVVPNVRTDPSLASLHETLAREGIGAVAFIPLVHERRLLGKFMLYYNAPHSFSISEGKLAQTVASTVAAAVTRKAGEADLRQKERLLSDFFENATVGLHWVGPDGRIVWANPAELRMLGYGSSEYIGHDIREFHADRPVIEELLARILRGETVTSAPARMRAKDGTIRHVLIDSSGYFENGRFVHSRCFTRDVTPQQEVEAALRESRERFGLVAELSRDPVFTADGAGTITFVNAAACQLLGQSRERLMGSRLREFIVPARPEDVVFDGANGEFRQRRLLAEAKPVAGSSVPVEVSLSRIHSADRSILVAHVRDLRDRMLVERTQSTLQAIVQSSPDAVLSVDAAGNITSWNGEAQGLFGSSAAEVEGRSLIILFGRDDRTLVREALARVARGETVERLEVQGQRKDGSHVTVRLRLAPLLLPDGTIRGASVFAHDVTEERERDAQVALFRSIFEYSSDGIAVIDPLGRYLLQNEAHRRLAGYSDEELRGKTPAIHLGDEAFQTIADALARTGKYRGELQSRTKDGQVLDIELSAFSIRDQSGQVIAHVGVKRNITERKSLERARQRSP